MGTAKTRAEKISWVKANIKKYDKDQLLKNFCRLFNSTMATAREIYKIVN